MQTITSDEIGSGTLMGPRVVMIGRAGERQLCKAPRSVSAQRWLAAAQSNPSRAAFAGHESGVDCESRATSLL